MGRPEHLVRRKAEHLVRNKEFPKHAKCFFHVSNNKIMMVQLPVYIFKALNIIVKHFILNYVPRTWSKIFDKQVSEFF